MCSKLPLVGPARLTVPTLIMRGQYDGIAAIDDLIEFFRRLPNPAQTVLRHAWHLACELPAEELPDGLHILHAFFSHPIRYTGVDGCAC
jgi:pimeloyl-ACP methyl ester carboxylesterase